MSEYRFKNKFWKEEHYNWLSQQKYFSDSLENKELKEELAQRFNEYFNSDRTLKAIYRKFRGVHSFKNNVSRYGCCKCVKIRSRGPSSFKLNGI